MAKRNNCKFALDVLQSKISAIKSTGFNVERLADKLMEQRIITDIEYSTVKDRGTGQTTDSRLGYLIDLIINSIKQGDGEVFQILINIIRDENARRYDILAKSLEEAYDEKLSPSTSRSLRAQPSTITTGGNILDKGQVHEVLGALQKHHFTSVNWRRLFGRLGLSYDTLTIIEDNFHGKVERQLEEGVARWLQQNYDTNKNPLPSWKVLVAALRKIDENSVAFGIEKEMCPKTANSN